MKAFIKRSNMAGREIKYF